MDQVFGRIGRDLCDALKIGFALEAVRFGVARGGVERLF